MPRRLLTITCSCQVKFRPQVNRSKAQWKKLVKEYGISEVIEAEFCRQHKIANSSFLKRRKHFSTQPTKDFVNITEPLTSTLSTYKTQLKTG